LSNVPAEYAEWLCGQEGFKDKNPKLWQFFMEGDAVSSTEAERGVIDLEKQLLLSMSTTFTRWWMKAYGDRLRLAGEMFYIPYLRVAIEAWHAAELQFEKAGISLSPPMPMSTPKPLPIAKTAIGPATSPLSKPLDKVETPDEDVPF
jgi:hypothetical protein